MTSKHDPAAAQQADSTAVSGRSEASDSSPLTEAPNAENVAPGADTRSRCICGVLESMHHAVLDGHAFQLYSAEARPVADGGVEWREAEHKFLPVDDRGGLNPRQRDALGGFFTRGFTTQQAVDRAVRAAREMIPDSVYSEAIAPKLAGWIAHARQERSVHVAIPVDVAEAIHAVLLGVSAASAPEIFVRDPRAALTGNPNAVSPGPVQPVDPVWKIGDRVCFRHQPNGPVHVVSNIDGEMVELGDMTGGFAAHIFVEAKP